MLKQPPDWFNTDIPGYQNCVRIPAAVFDLIEELYTLPHQEGSHKFQESLRSLIETENNTETPGNKENANILAVSLAS